jgi:ATP-dependent helicase Lhr and Lhr-like helicase
VVDTSSSEGTSRNAFDRLAPFIQDFIWKNGWTELRSIQTRATAAAFDTDKHLLLASGTASGKTEAAFLPILTLLSQRPSSSVGALYIGPLKALINDQFLRLGDLCIEADIAVTAWHGDIAASQKHALLRKPSGILQITPEALEHLVLNRSADLKRLFGDLRWVVIDEIHAFMTSDRGGQVMSLLGRLARFANDRSKLPRRVGLSATLGDYAEAARWLAGETLNGVEVIAESHGRSVSLLVDNFQIEKPRVKPEPVSDERVSDELIATHHGLFEAAYSAVQGKKSLIFANARADAEECIAALRRMAQREHTPDMYHVHHGSIATSLREAAEVAMREGDSPACTAATVTLELGVDLGHLDRVLELGPAPSVASFLQRLGRSGRRGQRAEMYFLLREESSQADDETLERLPWELLQTIATIQLYQEEKWIEPVAVSKVPGSLLYQQTMSIATAAGELSAGQLAERVLTLAPFRYVSQDDFRTLLRHLIQIDHLELTERGGLITGLRGERVVRNFRFLATFQDPTEWAVKEGQSAIGTIGSPVPIGERFVLAGRTWEVLDLVLEQHLMHVKRLPGALKTHFLGGGGPPIDRRVVRRMRTVLVDTANYPYLTEPAAIRLEEARRLAASTGIALGPHMVKRGDNYLLVPWTGSRELQTMTMWLKADSGVRRVESETRFGLKVSARDDSNLSSILATLGARSWVPDEILKHLGRGELERAKFDEFLPDELLQKSFVTDHLDVNGAHGDLAETIVDSRQLQ